MGVDQDQQWTQQDQDKLSEEHEQRDRQARDQQEQQDRFSLYQASMVQGSTGDQLSMITSAYFDEVEQSVRTARRVAEVSALINIKQQIINEVTTQVLNNLRRIQAPA